MPNGGQFASEAAEVHEGDGMSDKIPAGFICAKCGKRNEFGVYVAAHSHEQLTHTCDCKAVHRIRNYRVYRAKTNKVAEVYQ